MKAFLAAFSSQEPRYHRIGSEDWDDAERGGVPQTIQWRRNCFTVRLAGCTLKGALGFVGSMALLMLLAFAGSCDEFTHPGWFVEEPLEMELPGLSPSSDSDPSNLKLRIIMPADDPGPDLCKTLLSAAANGYPAPIIVNWGRDFDKGDNDMGSSHLGKIDGTLNLLDALFSEDAPDQERLTEDDLVLVLDAYDVWFQLPPQLLIQRFLAQNAAANARLLRSFSAGASITGANYSDEAEEADRKEEGGREEEANVNWEEKQLRQVQPLPLVAPPRQSIVISAQKKCWPTRRYGNTVRCDAMPPSPARADLYGPWTDYSGAPHDNRPRHVNSGSILGTAGAMRRMFRAVQAKVEAGEAAAGSDQGVFAHVMGEQEVWRREAEAWNAKVAAGSYDEWVDVEGETRRLDDMGRRLDYGIGLDWVQDMFLPTVFAENDGDYLLLNESDAVHAASIAHDVFPVRIKGLPEDMRDITPPLELAGVAGPEEDDAKDEGKGKNDDSVTHTTTSSLPPSSSLFPPSPFASPDWTEVPLYTDYWSANVPVTVHHNAHKGGLKPQRLRDWWELTWFFPYLREVATAVTQKSGLSDLVLGDEGEEGTGRDGSPASRRRSNHTTAALARIHGRETELVYWAAETDAQRPAPKIFHENKLAKGSKPGLGSRSGSGAAPSLEEAGWPALCGGPSHEEWWDEVFKDGRGPLT